MMQQSKMIWIANAEEAEVPIYFFNTSRCLAENLIAIRLVHFVGLRLVSLDERIGGCIKFLEFEVT